MAEKLKGKSLVFGDLLELQNVQIEGKLNDVAKLREEIGELERNMLTAFVSFALSRSGFYNQTIIDLYPWDVKDRICFTTEFSDEDWVKFIDAFYCCEEFRSDLTDAEYEMMKGSQEWTVKYENKGGKTLNVTFLSGLSLWYFTEREGGVKWGDMYLSKIDRFVVNYIIVHPTTYQEDKLGFKELDSHLVKEIGRSTIFSIDGFLHEFFHDDIEKLDVKDVWVSIREEILKELRRRWPIVVFATHADQLSEINERLSHADLKYKLGDKHFEDAIKDAALACEGLLQVIHQMYKPRVVDKGLHFYEFLSGLKEIIVDEFGKNVYSDLDFIRIWRNKVLHTPTEKPDNLVTFQVIERAKMFHELFSKWSKRTRKSKSAS